MTLEEMDRNVRKEQQKKAKKQRKKRLRLWLLVGLLLLACGAVIVWTKYGGELPGRPEAETWGSSEAPTEGVRARIDVIDVGQGNAVLIQSGGEAMLVDGGGSKASSRTVAYLKERGVTRLKYLGVTH